MLVRYNEYVYDFWVVEGSSVIAVFWWSWQEKVENISSSHLRFEKRIEGMYSH